jgi:cobalamin biosynthesis protein CbiD
MQQAHGELETLSNSLSAGQEKMSVQTRHARSAAIMEILQVIQQRGCHATEALAQRVVFRASRGEAMVDLFSLH